MQSQQLDVSISISLEDMKKPVTSEQILMITEYYQTQHENSHQDVKFLKYLQELQEMNQGQANIRLAQITGAVSLMLLALALFSVNGDNLEAIPISALSTVANHDLLSLGTRIFELDMLHNPQNMLDVDDIGFYARNFQCRIVKERLRSQAAVLLAKYHSHSLIEKSMLFHLSPAELVVFFQVCLEEEETYRHCVEEEPSNVSNRGSSLSVMGLVHEVLKAKEDRFNVTLSLPAPNSVVLVTPMVRRPLYPLTSTSASEFNVNKKHKTTPEQSNGGSASLKSSSTNANVADFNINKKQKTQEQTNIVPHMTSSLKLLASSSVENVDERSSSYLLKNLLPQVTMKYMTLVNEVFNMNARKFPTIIICQSSLQQMLKMKSIYPNYCPKWKRLGPVPLVFTPEKDSVYYLRYEDVHRKDEASVGLFNIWVCQRSGSHIRDTDTILSYGIQLRLAKEVHFVTVENFFVIGSESKKVQIQLGRHALALCIEWAVKYCYTNDISSSSRPFAGFKADIFEEDGEIYLNFLKDIGFHRKKNCLVFLVSNVRL